MRIYPLAAESLGTRSMAIKIITDDISLIIDPGSSLGPHQRYKIPHPLEWIHNKNQTCKIIKEANDVELLFISHYHRDHFKPVETDYFYVYSDKKIIQQLYTNKIIYSKNRKNLGHYQKLRAESLKKELVENSEKYNSKFIEIGNQILEFGSTKIFFPPEILHRSLESRMGFVQPFLILDKKDFLLYLGDVHGLVFNQDIDPIIKFIENLQEDYKISGKINKSNNNGSNNERNNIDPIQHRRFLIIGGPTIKDIGNFKNLNNLNFLENSSKINNLNNLKNLNNQSPRNSFINFIRNLSYLIEKLNITEILVEHHPYRIIEDDVFLTNLMEILILYNNKIKSSDIKVRIWSYRSFLKINNKINGENIPKEKNREKLFREFKVQKKYLQWAKNALKGKVNMPPPIYDIEES